LDIARHNAETAQPSLSLDVPRGFIAFRLAPFDIVFSGDLEVERSLTAISDFVSQAEHTNSLIAFYTVLAVPAMQRYETGTLVGAVRKYLEAIYEFCGGVPEKKRIPEVLKELQQQLQQQRSTIAAR
jgi:hypothetical protein